MSAMQYTARYLLADPVLRAKANDAIRNRFASDPEMKAGYIERIMRVRQSENFKRAHAEVVRRIANDPKVKAKRSRSCKAWHDDPENKKKMDAGISKRESSEVFRITRALGIARYWHKFAQARGRVREALCQAEKIACYEVELQKLARQ